MSSVDIIFDRHDRLYKPGENVTGHVVVNARKPFEYNAFTFIVDGSVNMQLSAKSVGLFEAFYSPSKPMQVMSHSLNLKPPSKL